MMRGSANDRCDGPSSVTRQVGSTASLLRRAQLYLLSCVLLAPGAARCVAETAPATSSGPSERERGPTSLPPRTWAADASQNELAVIDHRGSYLRYRMHVIDEKGDQLRDVIESRDGTVARLLLRDGRPLTRDQDEAEQQRLNELLASPAAYQKHINADVTGKKRAADLIQMLPDAMLFSYAPGQPQSPGAGEQVVLDFTPNPEWKPPTLPAEALTGLRGRVWIDVKTHHMVRMEGEIFQNVNLGWGMLAKIYPGGHLALEQTTATPDRWIFAKFSEQLTVRALMVKTIHQNANISSMGYERVAPMPYQDAIRTLLATPLPR